MSLAALNRPHIMVIDPGLQIPEVECFNLIAMMAPLPCTYHMPAMQGMQSLHAERLDAVKGIVVLGSASSVNDRFDWQVTLEAWLKPHLDGGKPTLGICYGHQMLAHMYGGKVGYVHADQEKNIGFREIMVDDLAGAGPWAKEKGLVAVSHAETVTEIPAAMRVFASSPLVPTDGLRHRELPIFSFQSHPEATVEFLRNHAITGEPGKLSFGHALVKKFLDFAANGT